MFCSIDNWPKRKNGMKSTAGTTATAVIIRGKKMYVAQLGDSGAVLARRDKETGKMKGELITAEHKPDSPSERERLVLFKKNNF